MIDPRANSSEKLIPPLPLPYVSRKALKRVTDWVEPPEHWPNCGDVVFLVNHSEIYGREYSDWPYAYRCINHRDCDSYVGLHPNTDLPLGTLADKPTREARKQHKATFIAWQRFNSWSRNQTYVWLAKRMGISTEQCHWGLFSVAQAELAGGICGEALEQIQEAS